MRDIIARNTKKDTQTLPTTVLSKAEELCHAQVTRPADDTSNVPVLEERQRDQTLVAPVPLPGDEHLQMIGQSSVAMP
jgi:hypothetical protein